MLWLTVAGLTDVMFRHQSVRLTTAVIVLWSFTLWYNCLDISSGGRCCVLQLDSKTLPPLTVSHSSDLLSQAVSTLDQLTVTINVCLPRCSPVYIRLQLTSRQRWLKPLHAFDFLFKFYSRWNSFSRMEWIFWLLFAQAFRLVCPH